MANIPDDKIIASMAQLAIDNMRMLVREPSPLAISTDEFKRVFMNLYGLTSLSSEEALKVVAEAIEEFWRRAYL